MEIFDSRVELAGNRNDKFWQINDFDKSRTALNHLPKAEYQNESNENDYDLILYKR